MPISSYSKGMRQKVLLLAALLHNPDLILLGAPFSRLDVATGLVLRSLIQELAARGKVFGVAFPHVGHQMLRAKLDCPWPSGAPIFGSILNPFSSPVLQLRK